MRSVPHGLPFRSINRISRLWPPKLRVPILPLLPGTHHAQGPKYISGTSEDRPYEDAVRREAVLFPRGDAVPEGCVLPNLAPEAQKNVSLKCGKGIHPAFRSQSRSWPEHSTGLHHTPAREAHVFPNSRAFPQRDWAFQHHITSDPHLWAD